MRLGVARSLAVSSDFGLRNWASKAKFTKIEDSLPWTPMNRLAKYDAASFVLGGEIRNRTNKHTHTNKQ